MKTVFFILLFCAFSYLKAADLTLKDGTVFQNYVIADANHKGIMVFHKQGVITVKPDSLPDGIRAKYKKLEKRHLKAKKRYAKNLIKLKKQRELDKKIAKLDKYKLDFKGKVSQIINSGVLAYQVRTIIGYGGYNFRIKVKTDHQTDNLFCVENIPDINNIVDGDKWRGTIWRIGTFRYKSVGAGIKTIKRYTASKQRALEYYKLK